jgi:hypothetical protein
MAKSLIRPHRPPRSGLGSRVAAPGALQLVAADACGCPSTRWDHQPVRWPRGAGPSSTGTATARTYGNIGRLDLILESEGDTTNRYRVSKQADVLMFFYLISAEEPIVCSQPSTSVCDVITVR